MSWKNWRLLCLAVAVQFLFGASSYQVSAAQTKAEERLSSPQAEARKQSSDRPGPNRTRMITPRVRYKRIQPTARTRDRLRSRTAAIQNATVRPDRSATRRENGLVTTVLDPARHSNLIFFEITEDGRQVAGCTSPKTAVSRKTTETGGNR